MNTQNLIGTYNLFTQDQIEARSQSKRKKKSIKSIGIN